VRKRLLAAIALAIGLTVVPVTMHWVNHAKTPKLGLAEACAETGGGEECCLSLGDLCMLGGKILSDYRPSGGLSCSIRPGF
jgi:hypothetical protein